MEFEPQKQDPIEVLRNTIWEDVCDPNKQDAVREALQQVMPDLTMSRDITAELLDSAAINKAIEERVEELTSGGQDA